MSPTVVVPSEWVLAYLIGIVFCFYKAYKTDKVELFFTVGMIYLLTLSIGLRLHYA
jgi:hypothetical protein